MGRKVFLGCGIVAQLLYLAMLVFVPLQWPAYSSITQTVSELSAIDAPTRPLWVALGILYTLLVAAFGWGVWRSAGANRPLRVAGAVLMVQGLIGPFWPPMHLRGTAPTLTDALHIAYTMIILMLMLVVMGFGAAGLDKRFRVYTIVTVLVFIVGGTMTSFEARNVAADLPTPTIGVWERVNIVANMVWVVVFALILLRRNEPVGGREP